MTIHEVEFVARKLHDFFAKLRAEPDIEKRRKMVEAGHAKVLGEFVRAVEQAQAGNSEAVRQVEQPYVDQMIGGMVGELLALCDLRLEDGKAA